MGQNCLPKTMDMNRQFQASWASQPMGCLFIFILYLERIQH